MRAIVNKLRGPLLGVAVGVAIASATTVHVSCGNVTEACASDCPDLVGVETRLNALEAAVANHTDKFSAIDTILAGFEAKLKAVETAAPPGTVIAFAGTSVPSGWLLCDGGAVSRSQYAALFFAIGTVHGQGDGTTFNLPDYRGRFLRGVDGQSGRDPDKSTRVAPAPGGNSGNLVGSVQSDAFARHHHNLNSYSDVGLNNRSARGTNNILTNPTDEVGGNETRPINSYVQYIVRY